MRHKEEEHLNERVGFHAFLKEVSHRTGKPMTEIDPIVRAVFDAIKHNIYNKNWVSVPQFGTFYPYTTKSRMLRLLGGEAVWDKSHLVPKLSWSLKFKRQIRKVSIDDSKDNVEDRAPDSE